MKKFIKNFKSLPLKSKRILGLGLIFALLVALPLFVWAILTQQFEIRKRAEEGVPNDCGGTCGSHANCKAGLFCYQGFCRNPSCPEYTGYDCSTNCPTPTLTPTPSPTTKATAKPTASPKPKATPTPSATPIIIMPEETETPTPLESVLPSPTPEAKGFLENFSGIFRYLLTGLVGLVALLLLIIIFRKSKGGPPKITPPETNPPISVPPISTNGENQDHDSSSYTPPVKT